MSEGTVILPAALILGGFILVVFVAIPYFDRYYSNRTSWISGIVDRIGLNHVKTKFIPGLEVKERRKVLEEIFKAKDLKHNTSAGKDVASSMRKQDAGSGTSTEGTESEEGKRSDQRENKKDTSTMQSQKFVLQLLEIQGGDEPIDDNICAICLEPYDEENGSCVTGGTQCTHLYHKNCIIRWMEKRDFCPFCREDMFTVREFQTTACSALGEERVNEILAPSFSNHVAD